MQMDEETLERRVQRAVSEEITIAPYDPAWPQYFRQERDHLLACLPNDLIRRIDHVGSTAVPGLAAKPIVDMLVEVADLPATRARIRSAQDTAGVRDTARPGDLHKGQDGVHRGNHGVRTTVLWQALTPAVIYGTPNSTAQQGNR